MKRSTKKRLGANIKAKRIAAGLTQAALGEKLGIFSHEVCRFEKGILDPSAGTLMRLASVLSCSVYDLWEGVDDEDQGS